MSWERAIKKEWDIRDFHQRKEDKCIVKYCAAQSCKYNSEKNCILKHVDITKDGRCRQFRPQGQTGEYLEGVPEGQIPEKDYREWHKKDIKN